MARDSKLEVAAVNLRIPKNKPREYDKLLLAIQKLKQPVNVFGDSYLMITSYDEEDHFGVISKYTQIDTRSDWFNIDTFSKASDDEIGKITIPASLKPNLAQFFFKLDPDLHVVAFEKYSESKALSLNAVDTFFRHVLANDAIVSEYGTVQSSIVFSHPNAAKLLKLPDLKEVRMVIRRPNSDDVGDDLASIIEDRLTRQNADEYEEVIRAKAGSTLEPDERTNKLGLVAVENGELAVKSLVNGVTVSQNASKTPLVEVEKYKSDEAATPVFHRLATALFGKISSARRQVRG